MSVESSNDNSELRRINKGIILLTLSKNMDKFILFDEQIDLYISKYVDNFNILDSTKSQLLSNQKNLENLIVTLYSHIIKNINKDFVNCGLPLNVDDLTRYPSIGLFFIKEAQYIMMTEYFTHYWVHWFGDMERSYMLGFNLVLRAFRELTC